MSAENPIILDEQTANTDADDEPILTSFLQVMPHYSKECALNKLQQSDYNLEQALLLALDEQEKPGKAPKQSTVSSDTASSLPSNSLFFSANKPSSCNDNDNDDATQQDSSTLLCEEWHRRHDLALQFGHTFVDSEFPPSSISLDGRKHHSASTTTIVTCHCGVAAKSRTVQRNGPNYGRFYLCCVVLVVARSVISFRGTSTAIEADKKVAIPTSLGIPLDLLYMY